MKYLDLMNSPEKMPLQDPELNTSTNELEEAVEDSDLELVNAAKGVFISTYGCQMNVNDTERMYSLLEMADYVPVDSPEKASLILINSCSVREKPVHKVHSEMGRYQKLKKKNPFLKLGVAGCVGQQEKDKLLKDIPILDFVFGPDNIDSLPQMVKDLENRSRNASLKGLTGSARMNFARFEHGKPYQIETLVRNPGISTFVNITKGCDNFCTFCVVPYTRGRLRSRSEKEILRDIDALVTRGVKEVTLLGQNVNSYSFEVPGVDQNRSFSNLLSRIATETGIERIRYTTSHPKDFNQELVDVMAKYREKICAYIHLPVQSGSTEILHKMNRVYSREEYLDKIKMIRSAIPDVALSTDIIVGFPGETEKDYLDTESLMLEVGYETIYAFKYSPRPFTKAAKYLNQVSEEESSDRLTRLLAKHKEQAFQIAKKYEGLTLDVLVEEEVKGYAGQVRGRTTHNKVIHFTGTKDLIGKTVPVKISQSFPLTSYGEVVQ